ncbi:Pkinase-domain-containing protein [Martensiomyces pterosporus]|nr:Pkinase-domain-containing protein [Martensiomyces pterosporus]
MAFINKILQKTKNKIGDRDRDSVSPGYSSPEKPAHYSAATLAGPVPIPPTTAGSHAHTVPSNVTQPHLISQQQQQQQQAYATLPPQKHVVPSNVPPMQQPSSTSVATRAASFSVGAQSAVVSKGAAGLYVPLQQNAIATNEYTQQQQPQQQQQQQQQHGIHGDHQNQSQNQHPHQHQHLLHHHHHYQQQPMMQPADLQGVERSYEDTHVKLDDFEVFRTVGTGSFGRVRLVRHKATNKHYAMKVLKKNHVNQSQNQHPHQHQHLLHHHHHYQQQPMMQPADLQGVERSYEDTHVKLDDFEVFRTVGTGSFGRVRLVRHKATNKHYAMKVLKKNHVVKAKQVEHVNSERRILAECSCPFIVYMLGTCQDNVNLYFFMEYVVGGELFTYLRRYHRFPPPVAKFYAAEVLLALEYLHSRHIIWRDTKPENILLDHRGHVKLTDMGFAKKVTDRTWTLCGTPDYLAPEVIQAKGYGKSVDWWALGILIFEMIAGYPPFYDEDHYRLYEKILAGRIQWPAQFDPVARDLVSRLLTADLSRRLGNLHRGSADIKEHRWFAEVDWNRLAAREIPAPLIPPQKVDGDTSNFDKYPETNEKYGDMATPDPYADLFLEF